MKYIYTTKPLPFTTTTRKIANKTVHRSKSNAKARRHIRRHSIETIQAS